MYSNRPKRFTNLCNQNDVLSCKPYGVWRHSDIPSDIRARYIDGTAKMQMARGKNDSLLQRNHGDDYSRAETDLRNDLRVSPCEEIHLQHAITLNFVKNGYITFGYTTPPRTSFDKCSRRVGPLARRYFADPVTD